MQNFTTFVYPHKIVATETVTLKLIPNSCETVQIQKSVKFQKLHTREDKIINDIFSVGRRGWFRQFYKIDIKFDLCIAKCCKHYEIEAILLTKFTLHAWNC